jgi:hypothetical protein
MAFHTSLKVVHRWIEESSSETGSFKIPVKH